MVKISIKKDGEWYLAEVDENDNLYAYWYTENDAKKKLLWVVEMTMDYHLELVENEIIKNLNMKKYNFKYSSKNFLFPWFQQNRSLL